MNKLINNLAKDIAKQDLANLTHAKRTCNTEREAPTANMIGKVIKPFGMD